VSEPSQAQETVNTSTAPLTQAPKPGRPTGWRKWLFRLLAITLVPAILFGTLEAGLRIVGYGRNTSFYLDGSRLERPGTWIDNREFGRWAFPRGLEQSPSPAPFILKADKKPGTFRIFVLGESAAMGYPEPSFSFGRILEVMLRARYPDTKFEVVNAAMIAINSYIVLPIAEESADRKPDLFVVHLGNNEVVGPYGAAGVLGSSAPSRWAVRNSLAARQLKTGQLFSSLIGRLKGGNDGSRAWSGMKMFMDSQVRSDDSRLPRTYDHFRENLRDICKLGNSGHFPVVVCTIPVNLKDSAPFGSLHAANLTQDQTKQWNDAYSQGNRLEGEKKFAEALASYRDAERIDDQFADLVYRQARCLAALGNQAEARQKYIRARDLDSIRFRSDTIINRTIREIAAERADKGVLLADAESSFEEASPMGVPGEELFLEHVHMNFAGNYLMARTVYQTMIPLLDKQLTGEKKPDPLSERQCAEQLAYTSWNEQGVMNHIQADLREAPFTNQLDREERSIRWEEKLRVMRARLDKETLQAVDQHRAVVDANKDDWMIRMNYAKILTEVGNPALAEEQYRAVIAMCRHNAQAYIRLGQLLLKMNKPDGAEFQFREALRISPDWVDALLGLADALGAQGKVDEGLAIYEDRLAKAADRATMLLRLSTYLIKIQRYEDARPRLEEVLQLKPDEVLTHGLLGEIAEKQGRIQEAIGHYEAVLRQRPDWPKLRNRIAELKNEPVTSPKK
jgi:tetratricopeptide (TPR) repeat protein